MFSFHLQKVLELQIASLYGADVHFLQIFYPVENLSIVYSNGE